MRNFCNDLKDLFLLSLFCDRAACAKTVAAQPQQKNSCIMRQSRMCEKDLCGTAATEKFVLN